MRQGDGLKIMKGVIIRIYVSQNLQTEFQFFTELLCRSQSGVGCSQGYVVNGFLALMQTKLSLANKCLVLNASFKVKLEDVT